MQTSQTQLKSAIKKALIEALEEEREAFGKLIAESLEDVGMKRAIQAGVKTKRVSRSAVLKALH